MATRIFSIASIFATLASATLDPYQPWDDYFDHGTMLRPANDYRLYWTIHEETEMVEIGLQVETTGWVGFGISNDGMMPGADMIIGWIPDDAIFTHEAYLQRRHSISTANRYPVFDEDLSSDLQAAWQDNGVTFLHFTRELFPCADEQDPFLKQIIMGTTFVLFAFQDIDPVCSGRADIECELEAHNLQSMGSQSINFFSGESSVVAMPDEYDEFSFLMDNYAVPPEDTTYHCKFIELEPYINKTSHMIRYDPVIQPGNEAAVHHIILYWCQDFNESFIGEETDCNDHANMPELKCTQDINLAGWAVGASDFYFPEHVGYPIQGKMYMLLEIHYDNPNLVEGIIDSSGIKIYWTEELREFEAGQIGIGANYGSTWVPGDIGDSHVTQSFHSAPECSANTIPEEGVNMFVGLLHAHTIGVAMKLRHIRNNVELPPLIQNDQYDFNYQQWITFPNDVKLLPGDEFICECNYSTSRVYPTYGGQSTQDEMCVCTVYYYPATEFTFAGSMFSDEQYTDFFQTAIDNEWWNGTTDWSTNRDNQQSERYYYNGKDPDAFQHYLDFQNTPNRGVFCGGCPDGFCSDFIIPDARPDFVPLPPDDFGDCSDDEEAGSGDESGLTDEEVIIIGSVAGAIVVLLIAILGIYICKRKRKEKWIKSYENMDETDKKAENQAYGATTQ